MIRPETLALIQTDGQHIVQNTPEVAEFSAHQITDLIIALANSNKQFAVQFMQGVVAKDGNMATQAMLKLHSGLATLAANCALYMDRIEDAVANENKVIITSYTADGEKMVNLMAKK